MEIHNTKQLHNRPRHQVQSSIKVNSHSIVRLPPRLSNYSSHWVRISALPLPLTTWNVKKMDTSRQCTAITKASSLLLIQTWENFYSVPHKMFIMESNGFYSKTRYRHLKENSLFYEARIKYGCFHKNASLQIKLSLQHFKSEVLSMVTIYNSVFCLTIKWKEV